MGNKLFGIDIAKVLNDSIKSAGGLLDLTITRRVSGARKTSTSDAGLTVTESTMTGKGILDMFAASQIDGTRIRQGDRRVLVLGDSLSPAGIAPETGDKVSIEGATYTVREVVDRDPAAATYTLAVR